MNDDKGRRMFGEDWERVKRERARSGSLARRLTYEQHQELGLELARMRDRLVKIDVELCDAYGSSKRVGRLAQRSWPAIDSLRCELDNQLARDYPAKFDPRAYYPPRREIPA